jgi:hypothetical protein
MQTVTRFEANLLRLLYFFLRQEPPERALPLVEDRCDAPPCLSKTTVRLMQEALAKGCTQLLASRGGWRKEAFLRGERPKTGRLWERTEPADLGLTFSRHTLEFVVWITAQHPGKDKSWHPPHAELTPGDRILLFFAYEALRHGARSLGVDELPQRAPLSQHGLLWLAYPEDYAATPERVEPDFAPWTSGVGAAMLEALQCNLLRQRDLTERPSLTDRWVDVETRKGRISEYDEMRALGRSQERVLTAFLDAAEKAARLDLARFLLRAAAQLLGPDAEPQMWVGGLNHSGQRLADRAAVTSHALTFLRHLDRLQRWERQARGVGYFDEGYHAAQLWKADWEQYQGDRLCERAQNIIRRLDPMRQT